MADISLYTEITIQYTGWQLFARGIIGSSIELILPMVNKPLESRDFDKNQDSGDD